MDKIKKITQEQNDQLFAFTIKHFVEYYDLQNELTDHLANAIEERWKTEPNLSFDDALKQEFKKFGIFGFMGVVESRQAALNKKYKKLMWGYMKEFIKIPQILITIALFYAVYKLIEFQVISYHIMLMVILLTGIGTIMTRMVKHRRKVKRTGKKWLFEEIIVKSGGMASVVYLPFNFSSLVDSEAPGPVRIGIMAAIVVLFLLMHFVVLFVIPRRAEEHLLKTYPEYNL
ncbi:hypothetical protein [Flavobacterium suzhouense]|uniref:RDD family protein n=1 Tax=Flavobacterium suzhouense TaxID=1529638 RepID=A0ABW5NU54_9FLAO